ncbi:type II secretion system F family protein [Candidatus Omnitrophota bacterium]
MPIFKYRAKNGPQNVDGVIEARNKEEVVEKLNLMGYIPVRIEEGAKEIKSQSITSGLFLAKIKSRDITIFTRQLGSLIKAGVPILKALNIIANQSDNSHFKSMLGNIQAEVKDGKTFSSTLTIYPKVFSLLYVAMVRSGESSGTLQEVLFKIADYRQKQDKIISDVRAALAYPILMAIVGAGTIFFMFTFVLPRLMRIFARIGQDLPLPTRVLISISSGFQKWWLWIILGIAILFFVIRQGAKTKAQKKFFSHLKLRLPIIGDFVYKSELARFSRTLEVLIRSGIPILNAIEVAVPILDNEAIKEEVAKSGSDLREGSSFGRSLENSKLIPEFMTSLLIVGEESGKLDEAMAEIASSYERDTEEAIKIMTSLLEPLMILLMGLIVGFIVISMLLPIFQMNMMVQ